MDPWIATLLAVAAVSLVSLVGAVALTLPRLRSHRALLLLVALAAGALVGDAFFHLVPEAAESWSDEGLSRMGLWVVGGFLALFSLEVLLRARHAHVEHADVATHAHAPHEPGHAIAPFAWTNLVGDAVHNLLDGAVIAAAFLADTSLGIATTIAVVVHEVPQELGDFAVLLRAGLAPGKALVLNLASALCAVVGAILVLALPIDPASLEHYGLPLIAGAFLYVAAADLVPELHHHSKGRDAVSILLAFLVGAGLLWGVLVLEDVGLL